MKTCHHCQKEDPDDFNYCRYCGVAIGYTPATKPKNIWKRIPAWAWIIIFDGGVAGILIATVGSFVATATIEGIASMLLLILGVIGFGIVPLLKPEQIGNFGRAIGSCFFCINGCVNRPNWKLHLQYTC